MTFYISSWIMLTVKSNDGFAATHSYFHMPCELVTVTTPSSSTHFEHGQFSPIFRTLKRKWKRKQKTDSRLKATNWRYSGILIIIIFVYPLTTNHPHLNLSIFLHSHNNTLSLNSVNPMMRHTKGARAETKQKPKS